MDNSDERGEDGLRVGAIQNAGAAYRIQTGEVLVGGFVGEVPLR